MTENEKLAEASAEIHFRDGRDRYEEMFSDIKELIESPPDGLTARAATGAFLLGVAKNNFYYGFLAARGEVK